MTQPIVQSRPTFCRICEAACGLIADLDVSGQPVRLRPDRQHPVSQGFACAKGTRFLEVATHPERLLWPLQRQADGGYTRLTWAAAMAFLAQRLRPILERHGPHAVGLYFGNPLALLILLLLFGWPIFSESTTKPTSDPRLSSLIRPKKCSSSLGLKS